MNVDRYLERIGVERSSISAGAEYLRLLQRQHLLSVPFENLDIHWKRPIFLDVERFYEKVVEDRRGGFCYELNWLFHDLLTVLGFQTRMISARVFNGSEYGPEFDHAAIIVRIDGEEYLADVGFGDFAAEPLRFASDVEQNDPTGNFSIRRLENEYFEVAKRVREERKPEYIFQDVGRELPDFAEMCDFQQYSPESHFTKGKLCSIMTPDGRKTLTDSKFIVTSDGGRTESSIDDEVEFYRVLNDEFGIEQIQ